MLHFVERGEEHFVEVVVVMLALADFFGKTGDGLVGVLFEGEQGGDILHFVVKIMNLNLFSKINRAPC